jgi:hypothetical protein
MTIIGSRLSFQTADFRLLRKSVAKYLQLALQLDDRSLTLDFGHDTGYPPALFAMLKVVLEKLPNRSLKPIALRGEPETLNLAADAGLNRFVIFEEADSIAVGRIFIATPDVPAAVSVAPTISEEPDTDAGLEAVSDPPAAASRTTSSTGEFTVDRERERQRALAALMAESNRPKKEPTGPQAPPTVTTQAETPRSLSLKEKYNQQRRGAKRETAGVEAGAAGNAGYLVDPVNARAQPVNRLGSVIGRNDICSIIVKNKAISKQNTRIALVGGAWWIEDLGSTNGTWVNGRRIGGRAKLAHGDRIAIGITSATPEGAKVYTFEIRDA